jgi:hypothetical protein
MSVDLVVERERMSATKEYKDKGRNKGMLQGVREKQRTPSPVQQAIDRSLGAL